MKTAAYWKPLSEDTVQCVLCPHHCLLPNNKHGLCLTRKNENGVLVSLNYLRPISSAIDPIEKKPLYHFFPNTSIFSTGPNGCNLKCSFCQNSEISQNIVLVPEVSLNTIVQTVLQSDSIGIAYTYSEPYMWFETIMEIAPMVRSHGLKNVMVTNGYMEPEPLKELLTVIDAFNIDIKSIKPSFYKKLCKASLEPVLRTCETVKKSCHLEITNLIIPNENDTPEELYELFCYIANNLGRDTPLHVSRYFPRYNLKTPPTPQSTLQQSWDIAREVLDYVYVGNIDLPGSSDTCCPTCSSLLIQRGAYSTHITDNLVINSSLHTAHCKKCLNSVSGVF